MASVKIKKVQLKRFVLSLKKEEAEDLMYILNCYRRSSVSYSHFSESLANKIKDSLSQERLN